LYENECGDSIVGGGMAHGHPVGPPLDKVAPDLDYVSIDLYKGYLPSDDNGTAEAIAARAFVEKEGESPQQQYSLWTQAFVYTAKTSLALF
jgi:hypothetical protein